MWDAFKKTVRYLGPKGCFVVITLTLISIVLFQNMDPADVELLRWEFYGVPKMYLLGITFSSGFLFAAIVLKWPARRRPAPPPPRK